MPVAKPTFTRIPVAKATLAGLAIALGFVVLGTGIGACSAIGGSGVVVEQARDIGDFTAVAVEDGLPALLEYVVPFLRVGGTALLPKGLEIVEELRAGSRAAAALGAEIVSADRLPVAGTRLVVAIKRRRTEARYPRGVGIPSRVPLGRGP